MHKKTVGEEEGDVSNEPSVSPAVGNPRPPGNRGVGIDVSLLHAFPAGRVSWFYNAMHFPETMPAFDVLTAEIPYQALGAFTTRVFSFPTTLGIDHRIVNGRIYITAYPVTEPKEIQRRLSIFQERAGHYFQNWNKLYEEWKGRMLALIKEVEDITVPSLPEFDDIEVVTSGRGIGQNHYVRETYHRC